MPVPKEDITPDVFSHLVELAALELDESQSEYLLGELNKQLASIRELEAIQLDESLPAATYGVPYPPENKPDLRDDHWEKSPVAKAITEEAPQFEDGYIIVPDIPHTTLE
jgi:aspartyl-tRNA(Asn)/glutamyl-tRNA(Gln) amidotransferase subunit C